MSMMTSPATYSVLFVDDHGILPYRSSSVVLRSDTYHPPGRPHQISSKALETYGVTNVTDVIRIGNGGLGPTGLLRALCEGYLREEQLDKRLKLEWVCNHSRYTQIALEGRVIDIGFTYEREEELAAEQEGWSRTAGILCHDHFVLAGPQEDPAGISGHQNIESALRKLVEAASVSSNKVVFHTRGDGSATMHKEHQLWNDASIEVEALVNSRWYHRIPCAPLEALNGANQEKAYLLTDRATFLLAREKGMVDKMAVFVEGGKRLMNTCAIILRSEENRQSVHKLVEWLQGSRAQSIIATYGCDWSSGLALVTPSSQADFPIAASLRIAFPPHEHNVLLSPETVVVCQTELSRSRISRL